MTIKQLLDMLGPDYDVLTLHPDKLISHKKLRRELIALQREKKIEKLLK